MTMRAQCGWVAAGLLGALLLVQPAFSRSIDASLPISESHARDGSISRAGDGSIQVAEAKRKPAAKTTTRRTTRTTTRPTSRSTTRSSTRTGTRTTTKKATRTTTKKATRTTTKKATRTTTKKATRTTTKKATRATTKKATRATTKKATRTTGTKKATRTTGTKKGTRTTGTKKGTIQGPGTKKGTRTTDTKKGSVQGSGAKKGTSTAGKKGPIQGPGVKKGTSTAKKGTTTKKGTTAKKGPIQGPSKKGTKTAKQAPKGKKGGAKKGGRTRVTNVTNITVINNRNTTIFRGPRTVLVGGLIRTLIDAAILDPILIADPGFVVDPGADPGLYVDRVYYPQGYAVVPRPICRGITAEGCRLRWQDVATEDGGVATQCVQYCRRPGVTIRPTKFVEVPPEPAPTDQESEAAVSGEGCELAIYSEPNFGGASSDTGEPQPKLSEVGWLYEISSIEVKAGTWDFYEAEDYGGESMQLSVGTYPTLTEGWDKAIASFLCSQPAQ